MRARTLAALALCVAAIAGCSSSSSSSPTRRADSARASNDGGLQDRLPAPRPVEAVIWGMPAVN
jgi:hypothetical protein